MSGWLEDFKYAFRQVRSNPRLLLLVIAILSIGIGANTTIYSLIEAAGHLPVRDQNTLVLLWSVNPARMLDRTPVSPGDFADMRAQLSALDSLAAFFEDIVHVKGSAEPMRVDVQRVTSNYFSVLGVSPALGRTFDTVDANSSEPVVILANSTWETNFGGDRGILARTIEINGVAHRIIGVMKPDFQYLSEDTGLWLPIKDPASTDDRSERGLMAVGRLRRLEDMPQLQVQLAALSTQLAAEHAQTDAGWQFNITNTVPVRRDEAIVLALVIVLPVLVLGVACANIANIFLARGVGRQREVAVRVALGASRRRIVRLHLMESALYAFVGGTAGVLAGVWGTDSIRGFSIFWKNATVDVPVLIASLATAALCGLLFGLMPALRMSSVEPGQALKRDSSRTTIDSKGRRLRSLLMFGEVSAAALLLLLCGLVLRSVMELRGMDTGFRINGVQTFRTALLEYRHASPADAVQGHQAILDSLRQIPGVLIAGAGNRVPTQGGRNNPTQQLEIEGRDYLGKDRDWAMDLTVTTGYFEALDVPVLRGRLFGPGDIAAAPPVAIVSLAMAKKYWSDANPVGQKFKLTEAGAAAPWIMVSGVVGDVRNDDAGSPPVPTIYLPLTQHPVRTLTYVLQTSPDYSIPLAAIRDAVAKVEPSIPVYDVKTMRQLINDDLAGAYFTTGFFAVLGIIAVSLAALGIFGVLSHVAAESRPEIAIRIALGAKPSQIVWKFVWSTLRRTLAGIVVGSVGAIAAFRMIRSTLSNISVVDPLAVGTAVGLLLLIAAVACYLPLRRAASFDPMVVLRSE
jgi:putative ABC transport system permease protein